MADNKIGCSSKKTILVDPNMFDGQSSMSNMSVPLEDLSISVQLETSKKARTILTSTKEGKKIGNSSTGVKVRFIEGIDVAGKKVLTTKYTDLTTSFDDGESNDESLGITAIDIDFNSSYAPLVTINFVDLRGSAIFQNESYIAGGANKFSTFFQLPYPLYSLTIKGYYGMPVKYDLHMTKFTAKFNSQTGNFEITASFVGYTYAMLSDMLLGYLKAIPYTSLGADKYNEMRASNPSLLTLDELMLNISKIDAEAQKIKASDEGVAQLNKGNQKQEQLNYIKTNIVSFGQEIDVINDLSEYRFVIPRADADITKAMKSYNDNIIKTIDDFNTENDITIDSKDFTGKSIREYKDLTLRLLLNTDDTSISEQEKQKRLTNKFGNPAYSEDDFQRTREELVNFAKRHGIDALDTIFTAYDFRSQYRLLDEKNEAILNQIKSLKKTLGELLKLKAKEILGLDPTVRNITEVFTASVEALMSVLFRVSQMAITDDKEKREKQLKKFGPSGNQTGPNSYDIKFANIEPTNSSLVAPVTPMYYPWPEYRVDDAKDGLIDTYLGEVGVLDIPSDVTELWFIDDLLKAFLISKKKEEEAIIADTQLQTNWLPANPLDTRLFVDSFPYTRISGNRKKDIVNMLLERAFIYLGVSNYKLTPTEIKAFAEAECNGVLSDIPNDLIIDALTQLNENDFYSATGKNDNSEVEMMKLLTSVDQYYYNFIFGIPAPNTGYNTSSVQDASTIHVLPINVLSKDKFEFDFTLFNLVEKAAAGNIFLTNYTTTPVLDNSNVIIPKPYDGGIYVKMIKPTDYDGPTAKQLPVTPSEALLDLSVLRQEQDKFNAEGWSSAGFSQFGGKYGIQEYRLLNFNTAGLEKGPFMAMFYQDSDYSDKQLVKSNTLSKKRTKDSKTDFDKQNDGWYKSCFANLVNPVAVPFSSSKFDDIIDALCGDDKTHEAMGKNRLLLTDYMVNKSQDISFPFVSFQVAVDTDDANFGKSDDSTIVGLFGSRFYYEQNNLAQGTPFDYSKALLFLHTFPWNGFYLTEDGDPEGIFSTNEILNTFGNRAGFVSAPKLWTAFIGGLLWRADTSAPIKNSNQVIYSGGSGPSDPISFGNATESYIPTYGTSSSIPSRTDYITAHFDSDFQSAPMIFPSDRFYVFNNRDYKPIEQVLLQLPDQVKDEFKKAFFDFVAKGDGSVSDWQRLKPTLEVFNGDGTAWVNTWNTIMVDQTSNPLGALEKIVGAQDTFAHTFVSTSIMKNNYNAIHDGKKTFDDYIIFSPYISLESFLFNDLEFKYNFVTELKDDSDAVKIILDLLVEETIISNMSYKIWQKKLTDNTFWSSTANLKPNEGIYISKEDIKVYTDTVLSKLKPSEGKSSQDKKKQREQEIFGTDNENLIKLQLYRTCKNIYDKWIGGTESENKLIFRDGNAGRNGLDKELAVKYGRNVNNLSLIDSFRFVDRSFTDIGDKLYINPLPVNDFLKNNPNSSFYDCVTSLLSSNNFDFIALPTYINYGDPETLESMFKPMPSEEAFVQGTTGPAFVCVYVGQTSKNLDFNGSEYENDGVTFRCDSNGNLVPTAKDFVGNDAAPYENKVAVFAVNYSQQNQNIFKDIILDQSEFSETAESLQITDDIANRGAENRKTFGGQNMYNVYSVRSYKTEIEMMGNAMIQPMMYFQLNNIPMFHGAYMITHVKHSLKPNSMSTHFTGVRIRNVMTPLLDATDLFMSLIDSIEASSTAESKQNFGSVTNTNNKTQVIGTNADYVGYVTYDVPESDSLKFQEHINGVKAKGDSFAMQECGEFMVELAKKWRAASISSLGTDVLYINNFGAYGGGTNKKHGGDGGLHAIGLACDIQPMANIKGQQKVLVNNSIYDQAANIKFIQMAIDLSKSQNKIKIQNIILNDSTIINHFAGINNSLGGRIVTSAPGHDNHIHIEFDRPPRVVSEVAEHKKQDDKLVSSAPIGAVAKFNGKLPTETEKLNALGQI